MDIRTIHDLLYISPEIRAELKRMKLIALYGEPSPEPEGF